MMAPDRRALVLHEVLLFLYLLCADSHIRDSYNIHVYVCFQTLNITFMVIFKDRLTKNLKKSSDNLSYKVDIFT